MIVPLVRLSLVGLVADKERVIRDLQDLGVLHLIPLRPSADATSGAGPSSEAREALQFLLGCPQRRRQAIYADGFDALAVEQQALALRQRLEALSDERDFLAGRIADLQPWGEFALPPLDALAGLRLWFYAIPHQDMHLPARPDLVWHEVGRDSRCVYGVVIAAEEPQDMPVPRVHTGSQPLSALRRRQEQVEMEVEDVQAERRALSRWCTLYAQALYRLEDQAAAAQAARMTLDDGPLFALQAWAPQAALASLRRCAAAHGLVVEVAEPAPGETPPTLMENPEGVAAGQDLVSFYMIPNYRLWDPSAVVFFSFTVFFAMIMADAGYGALMALGLALGWKRLGTTVSARRLRTLAVWMVAATIVFGIAIGSYFGVAPSEVPALARLAVFDMNNYDSMMRVSILLGVAHLVLASGITVWRNRRTLAALAPAGWVLLYIGALVLWLGAAVPAAAMAGKAGLGLGLLLIVLFSRTEGTWLQRLLGGLGGLTKLSAAFGDTLSYLRLFALGLASGCLAVTFNDLARSALDSVPGLGLLFAILIIVLGHGLNLVMGVSSGFIHGLRLNFIEFFNWSVSEEGVPFRAFYRKEKQVWNS